MVLPPTPQPAQRSPGSLGGSRGPGQVRIGTAVLMHPQRVCVRLSLAQARVMGPARLKGCWALWGLFILTTGPRGMERARLWVLAAPGHPWGWVALVGRTLCGTLVSSAGKGRAS